MPEVGRQELLDALRLAAKVSEKKSSIPLRSMVWLANDHVVAHGATVSVRIPLETGIIGGIMPKMLIDLLGRLRTDTVEIKNKAGSEGDLLTINGEDAVARLPLADATAFAEWEKETWTEDEGIELPSVLFDGEPLKAMQMVDPVAFETVEFASLHINVNKVVGDNVKCTLYSSDRKTIHRRSVMCPADSLTENVLVPLEFLELVTSQFGDAIGGFMATKNHIMVETEDGVRLQGVLPKPSDNPPPFSRACQSVWPDSTINPKLLQPLPENFADTLGRAAVMSDKDLITLVVEDDMLRVRAKTQHGEFSEKVGEFRQPALRVRVAPKHIQRVLQFADRGYITERAVILYGQDGLSFYIYAQRTEDE